MTDLSKTQALLARERQYSAHNYTPLPVVFASGLGARVTDVEGREFWDFGGSYCANNQGHAHPLILAALVAQSQKLALCSRAFTHALFADWSAFLCTTFRYDKCLPLNGGSEIVDAAIKLSRAYGYVHRKVGPDMARVVAMEANYHGRTLLATSLSTTPNSRLNYGPLVGKVGAAYVDRLGTESVVKFNDIQSLRDAFEGQAGSDICAVLVESIQGEAGCIFPDAGYLRAVKALCEEHGALYIADEIQVGLGRAGEMVYAESQGVKPDILLLAKSISGGVYPTSVLLTSDKLMACIHPNSHGATFSGSPLSCAVSKTAVQVILDEDLCAKSKQLGAVLKDGLLKLKDEFSALTAVRGQGLLVAIDLDPTHLNAPTGSEKFQNWTSWHLCMYLLTKGIVAKLVQTNTLKLTPPLVIPEAGILECLAALRSAFLEMPRMDHIDGAREFAYLSGQSTLA